MFLCQFIDVDKVAFCIIVLIREFSKVFQEIEMFRFGPLKLHGFSNRPRSIYQYSSMAPRLSGQNCKFFKFLLSLNSQKRLGYKENNTKYRSLT